VFSEAARKKKLEKERKAAEELKVLRTKAAIEATIERLRGKDPSVPGLPDS
jgi:hypothetical protein